MKICFIATKSIHTKRWVEYFSTKGHEVHLITNEDVTYDRCKSYVVKSNFPVIYPLIKLLKTKSIVKKINPDIIHGHQVTPFGLYAYLCKQHPLVITAWGSDIFIWPKKSKLIEIFTRKVLKNADLITCDGLNLVNEMISMGADSNTIELVLFGVDIQKFNPAARNENIRKELAGTNSNIVISVRNLNPVYNVETLIKAIPLVLKKNPNTTFVICSTGSEEGKLKEMTKSLNIENNVNFVGVVQNDKLPAILASSDVYVSTSLSDGGLATSTAEAMASGIPVVVTDFGLNGEWVKENENGFLFNLRDSKKLAERIDFLLENEACRNKFGKNGRKLIAEKLTYHVEMEKMEKLYLRLIEGL
jgi:glycosyltransferase involved in cell wall biosynthesis